MLCGAPKPRNAPCGGALVATARPRMRTFGQKYGPAAWIVPRDSTTGDSVQYAPPSIDEVDVHRQRAVRRRSTRRPVPRPRRMPLRRRRPCPRRGRRSIFTGRPDFHASSAAWPAMIDGYSSLPPKPPPVSICTTRILLGRQAEQRGERLVDVVGALHRAPHRDAARRDSAIGEHAVRLDVELFLRAGLVLAFDNRSPLRRRRRRRRRAATTVALEDVVGAPDRLLARASASSIVKTAGSGSIVDRDATARSSSRCRSRCASSTTGSSG